mmetsp:Transcript_11552/g.19773  ORF Transcript_11552/g.19773 Transcript_11552/m.19773 type:complete len:189 (-) Transcript_11552:8-574(-)
MAEPYEDDAGVRRVRYVMRAAARIPAGAEVTDTYSYSPDYKFGCYYGFVDNPGMHHDPTMWQAGTMTRRASRWAKIEVANLPFEVTLEQVDCLLHHLSKGMSLAAAADRADLKDLVSFAELSALAKGCNADTLIANAAKSRLTSIIEGRALAKAAAAKGALPGRAAFAEALRRSEELVLEELVACLSK